MLYIFYKSDLTHIVNIEALSHFDFTSSTPFWGIITYFTFFLFSLFMVLKIVKYYDIIERFKLRLRRTKPCLIWTALMIVHPMV